MKRRVISIFALVMVVAMVASLAVGCSFFQENDYRVANETYVTVNHNGVTLTISYNELMDYCNANSRLYSYVQYYGLSVGEALDLCIQSKIQATYLLAESMGYLTDASKTSQARYDALYGKGAKGKAEDVLTYAERLLAIYSVNNSIDTSIESYQKEAQNDEWAREYNKIDSENVKEIVLTDATLAYLDRFFGEEKECVIGADLDESKIVAKVIYDDDSESAEFVVPQEGYSVAFSSEKTENFQEKKEDKTFTVLFKETKEKADGEIEEIEHTYVYDYTLVYPRDVKAEAVEETDYSVVTIDEVDVNRYAKENEIPDAVKAVAQIRNIEDEYNALIANGGDKHKIEGYRLLIDNMKNSNRTMEYFYKSQFESQANSAFSSEVYAKSEASFNASSDLDARIVKQFKYLYENQKNGYYGKNTEETKKSFISALGSTGTGMDTLYYHPAVVDLDDYFFVKQVLFKFDAEVVKFLEDVRHDEDALDNACKYFMETETVLASNPDYDAEYECPLHALKEEGAECKFDGEGLCPSIAYADSEEKIIDVINRLEGELTALYAEGKYEEAEALFEKYLYSYCDDAGSFNADWGYLITAEKDDNSWVEDFTLLAKDIYAYNTTEGNAFVADGEIGISYTCNLTGNTTSDYAGVSVMMVANTPFIAKDGSELVFQDDASIIAYLKSTFNGKGKSLYEVLKNGLKEEDKSIAYNEYIKVVPQDIYERNEDKKNKITVNKDYKDVIEINVKKLKKNIYDQYLGK
ncbi:MAG: hypothetical protein J6R44_04025 [Clostridia bacterium]|nr:hypothetical protein [Clostridia bacterium]